MKVSFILPSTTADLNDFQDYIETIHAHIIIQRLNDLDISYENKIKVLNQVRTTILHNVGEIQSN